MEGAGNFFLFSLLFCRLCRKRKKLSASFPFPTQEMDGGSTFSSFFFSLYFFFGGKRKVRGKREFWLCSFLSPPFFPSFFLEKEKSGNGREKMFAIILWIIIIESIIFFFFYFLSPFFCIGETKKWKKKYICKKHSFFGCAFPLYILHNREQTLITVHIVIFDFTGRNFVKEFLCARNFCLFNRLEL